jgi:TnpA family transposase
MPFSSWAVFASETTDLTKVHHRGFENRSFRASGLSLITAAIVHWDTIYLDRTLSRPP